MQYRPFGKLGFDVSILGFGAMRMPTRPDGALDEQAAIALIRQAISGGVNYIDTAHPYHGGLSEPTVGKALANGYREKVKVATKSPIWSVNGPDDFDRILDQQLERLQAGPIDFYLMHGIGSWAWDRIKKFGLLERAEKARAAGKIRHIGFSFHDNLATFKKIIDAYDDWAMCQIQYNYMNDDYQAGREGLLYAHAHHIPVVVMEPVLGGRIAAPPPKIREVFDAYPVKRSPAEWALRWVWNQPEVTTVLSGMSDRTQLEQNLALADQAGVHELAPADFNLLSEVRKRFEERILIPCTHCDYCMPCEFGVNIPWAFELYNNGKIYDDIEGARFGYLKQMPADARGDNCTECGSCLEKCPQKIRIPDRLKDVHRTLAEGAPYGAKEAT
ncbi:MAG TPA: aldo/keto reductase [Spirochaetia bacterium]|nr:aldo/keto reductase [Spirochaetia bacterium]